MRNGLIISKATVRAFMIAVIATLGLSGCNSGSEAPPADTMASETPAPAPATTPVEAAPCELTMGWDPWEPYHFAAAGGEVQGLDIDVINALGERVDCEFEFIQGNWASLLRLLQAGELDVLSGASITPEREAYAWFGDTYREERFTLFVRSEDTSQYQDRDLAALLADGFRVGVTQGYLYPEPIQMLQADDNLADQFVEVAIGELNINALMDYRIDGFLEDPFVVASIQRRSRVAGDIEALGIDFGLYDVHLLFSKASVDEAKVNEINQALQAMIDDGSHAEILQRYLN
ncbi:MAG: transporter substrate-binding domain-containing protein [Pseudomonadota bacterium]